MSLEMLTVAAIIIGVDLLSILCPAESTITLSPNAKQLSYVEGETAILTCHTTLDYAVLWQYSTVLDSVPHSIFRRGVVINGYRSRTTTDLRTPNTYTIQIQDLKPSDSGFYGCIEDDGLGPDEQYIEITVVAKEEQTTFAPTRQKQEATTDQPPSVTNAAIRPATEIVRQPNEQTTWIVVMCAVVVVIVVVVVVVVVVVCCIAVRRRRERAEVHGDDVDKKTSPIYKPATAIVEDETLVEVQRDDNSSNTLLTKKLTLA